MEKFVDYSNPPLEEVVFSVVFDRIENFPVSAFGKYWAEIADDFPKTADRPPLLPEGLAIDLNNPMIRTWFISEDDRRLMQLQQDRFIYNWRRIDAEWREYPEYSSIFPEFKQKFSEFASFVERSPLETDLKVYELELTYVNMIPFASVSDQISDLGSVLIDHRFDSNGDRFLDSPNEFKWISNFSMRDQLGRLTIDATSVRKAEEPNERALRLTLTCKGLPDEHESDPLAHWFDVAHEYIVKGFSDVVDDHVQRRKWGRR